MTNDEFEIISCIKTVNCKKSSNFLKLHFYVTLLIDLTLFDKFEKNINETAFGSILKACVSYFYQIFIFSPNDSPSKTIKNVFYFIEKALFVLKIFKFL